LQVKLRVSADEELVQLSLTGSGQTRELDSRACFYLLLTLARCRLQQGLPKGVRLDPDGWIETLALTELLRKSEQHLNIDIYLLGAGEAGLGCELELGAARHAELDPIVHVEVSAAGGLCVEGLGQREEYALVDALHDGLRREGDFGTAALQLDAVGREGDRRL